MSTTGVVLGVDVGGTNTALGFVDRAGRLLAETSILTSAHQPAERFFERLHAAVKQLAETVDERTELRGVGIGAPNANYYRGTIENPPNLSWDYVDVVAEMGKHVRVPVVITNDANAAALGEMVFGAAKGMKDFIVITLGTGLGSGIVAGGELIYGADGFAGEIGHTIAVPGGRECGCGRRGCLETYASASGLRRTMLELLCNSTDPSELRDESFEAMTSERVFHAAMRGDRLALQAFDDTARMLGAKLADSVAHLSPEAIILFGGLAAAGDLILKPTKRYLEESLLNIFRNKVKILPSGLPDGNTAVLGAAALIWNELERKARPKHVLAH